MGACLSLRVVSFFSLTLVFKSLLLHVGVVSNSHRDLSVVKICEG